MSFPSIVNRGEFFSNHYLDAVIAGDLNDLRSQWDDLEGKDMPTARFGVRAMRSKYFDARAIAADTTVGTTPELVDLVISALGFISERQTLELERNTTDQLDVPVVAEVSTSTGRLLVGIEASGADSLDDILETTADATDGRLINHVFRTGDKKAVHRVQPAVNEIFGVDEPPRFVLVTTGRFVLLAERAKWAEGRFLAVDLDAALERNDAKKKGELETIAALFSADALTPGGPAAGENGAGGQSVLDELSDKSQKHAVGVSKELRHGIRESIEILANEVIEQRRNAGLAVYQGENAVDAKQLTRQCLRWIYRLVVLLYAESRAELGVLPVNDEAYISGYSLDRLRELTLVELDTERSQKGSHLYDSLNLLFELVNEGYHEDHAQTALALFDSAEVADSTEEYLQFPGLDAVLFSPSATPYLNSVTLRNDALQRVLKLLTYSAGKGKSGTAGFISYAQLGINQLGAVYEGLMAYTGFFADEPLYEVAKGGDPEGGTWVLPVAKADDYPDEVFVTRVDEHGRTERLLHDKGSFVFRLSGRDRQRSASFYTPEVLTRCVVKHALAELLGLDDYAPEGGSMGITSAAGLLDITICEPALGSGAFANEAINQLSAEYLRMAQVETGEMLDPERYRHELQKVKAHFALHQTYGVDLNATAVELAEVSLWLNAMYPGLKAPWFGLQLRQGNSLIGCRRATWRASQLHDKPWVQTKKGHVKPPEDRKLSENLGPDEVHHFLLPGHGWAAVADRKEAKELRPDEVAALKQWRKTILASPKKTDEKRLVALAQAVEESWAQAADRIRLIQKGLHRPIDIYGVEDAGKASSTSRAQAVKALNDPNSPLGRLRTLMDAWIGLWYWPLDTDHRPPTWEQWLTVAEELVRPEKRHGPTGQLDLFDDLNDLVEAQQRLALGQASVEQLKDRHPWLETAVAMARQEAAFHWDLEFAPVFEQGGFDLQVGNPPWVRLDWKDDVVLAEDDPWWGITAKPSATSQKARREQVLESSAVQEQYINELVLAEGTTELLRSVHLRPALTGLRTNLYMVFMDTVWRHVNKRGVSGLLHPESHFTDPKAAALRRATYGHLRRHFMFYNEKILFEEVDHHTEFGVNVYAGESAIVFLQAASIMLPDTVDRSLAHDGNGVGPGIQYPQGGWDLRPHRSRILTIDEEVLADWARLFDEPGTPAAEARLLRPVTTADLEALSVLASQPVRLADHNYHWTHGWNETNAKTDGTIRWETAAPDSWDEVILQGPHFTIATPFAKQPNEDCKHNQDYSDWDLENLPEHVIPRTNYQRACDEATYASRLDQWNGEPATSPLRFAWRRMTQPGLERSLQGALVPAGCSHVHTVHTLAMRDELSTVLLAGLWSSLPLDYLVKVSGKADIQDEMIARFPALLESKLSQAIALRTLRLNCLSRSYEGVWKRSFNENWASESWTNHHFSTVPLQVEDPHWSLATPLRRDADRRMALVELDALAALMLGLSAEQLCAMYRTQFAVLRKYEYKMVFDAEGRKICGYHQSAGYRQSTLQDQAKSGEGDLPKEWSNLWKLYEQYEEEPDSVDWLGHYTAPFRRADREAEMTHAYNEFQRRLDAGENEQ